MVRAGVVNHPQDWQWTGFQELMGIRQRYRMVDLVRLLEHVGAGSEESFRENYARCVDEALERRDIQRESKWTESLAVRSQTYVSKGGRSIQNRMGVEILADDENPSMWIVREAVQPYAYS